MPTVLLFEKGKVTKSLGRAHGVELNEEQVKNLVDEH
jgi:hypothetical protein